MEKIHTFSSPQLKYLFGDFSENVYYHPNHYYHRDKPNWGKLDALYESNRYYDHNTPDVISLFDH